MPEVAPLETSNSLRCLCASLSFVDILIADVFLNLVWRVEGEGSDIVVGLWGSLKQA